MRRINAHFSGKILFLFLSFGFVCCHHFVHNDNLISNSAGNSNQMNIQNVEVGNYQQEGKVIPIYSKDSPPLTVFLKKFLPDVYFEGENLCSFNGQDYYFAADENGGSNIIYTQDSILCETPTLVCVNTQSASGTKYLVSTAFKTIVVDFSDQKSIESLKHLSPKFDCINRSFVDFKASFGNIYYSLEIDYPKKENVYFDNLSKWLIYLINEPLSEQEEYLKESGISNDHNSYSKSYEGNTEDIKAISEFAANKYMALKKMEYNDEPEAFPTLFNNLSLRLVCTNGKYFSYQELNSDYSGGAHGYYTEKIKSFDPARNEEIDWNYLFLSGCDEEILSIFYKVLLSNKQYQRFVGGRSLKEIKDVFESRKEDSGDDTILPKPGLTDTGVVFSFQPYEIGSYADGTFHFIIPYKDLESYLTTKAKELISK